MCLFCSVPVVVLRALLQSWGPQPVVADGDDIVVVIDIIVVVR